eukprot:CAMPEP_0178997804 /NCGR_PEP_ID=MMETSP0795-20121207/9159_1 /TAXON_ID=88552 /ORGANISM="Amoebophrya sp., Strain Ameob2" /LENGTH=41 /DNA_ID= /DNA_START= /DNA_END= /DNA_ORIENTATION=
MTNAYVYTTGSSAPAYWEQKPMRQPVVSWIIARELAVEVKL